MDYSEPFHTFVKRHDPLISVVITSYNKAPYLRECIESYLQQTYKNLEIIVVNDGSPDETSAVTQQIITENPDVTIRLLEKPNGGVSDARNAGLKDARGRVVLTMDGDDKAKPTYLETALRTLRETGADMFRPSQENFGLQTGEWIPQRYNKFHIRYDNCFPTPSIYDKRLFELSGGFKIYLGYVEDWEYWLSLSRLNPVVAETNELLTCYRMNDTGIHATLNDGGWMNLVCPVIVANEDLYPVTEVLQAHGFVPKANEQNMKRMRELDRLHPNQWFPKFFLGLIEYNNGAREAAKKLFSEAGNLTDWKNWQPLFWLAKVLQEGGLHEEACSMFHEVRILRPDMCEMVKTIIEQMTKQASEEQRAHEQS